MSLTRNRRLPLILVPSLAISVVAGVLLTAQPAPADTYLSVPFTGSTLAEASNWSTANYSGTQVCLTGLSSTATAISLAGGTTLPGCTSSPEAAGSGALRLVTNSTGQSGSIFYKDAQSTTYGLDVTFTMSMVGSGSSPGNGMTFFLKDGANATDTAGSGGAPLGYARLGEAGVTNIVGVPGGLLGVGFDAYGGYGDASYFAQNGCSNAGLSGLQANMVGVRGPDTSTASPKNGTAGYCWIDGTTSPGTLTSTTRAGAARQVRVVVDPATAATPKVSVYVGAAGGGAVPTSPTMQFNQPDELKTATSFKFGFSASTGAAVLSAYVWNLLIKKPNTQVLYAVPSGYTYTYGSNPGTITPTVVYQTTLGDATTNVANPATGNTGWVAPTCSATGTFNASTNAGTSTGAIGCTGGNGGTLYTLDNTSTANVIVSKANPTCTITPYAAIYTGGPITATGSCTGVSGATLSGLNLTGTTHTAVGTYPTDAWTFTDSTGNYNSASGTVSNTITALSVTYSGNGAASGSVPVDSTAYPLSGTVTVLGNSGSLARSGYAFEGWTTDAAGAGTKYVATNTFAISANTTLYALWSPFSVSYDGNGSTSGSVPVDATAYAASGTATVLGNTGSLARSGYLFSGWTTDASGAGTLYSANSSYALSGKNVVFYAKWTAAPSPSASPSSSQSSSAAPVPTPATSQTGSLNLITNQSNANVPAAGLPLGQSLLLVSGVPSAVRVVPNTPASPTALVASGDAFSMQVAGRGGNGNLLGLGSAAQLVFQSLQSSTQPRSVGLKPSGTSAMCVVGTPTAESSGSGFKPSSNVNLYLLPSTGLGSIQVGANGSFSGSVPVPAGLAPGAHTLQVNGFSPSGAVRSLSLGVQVVPARLGVTRKASARVVFKPKSSALSARDRKVLNALAKRAGTSSTHAVVVKFAQKKSQTKKERTVSARQARNVAAFLKSKGVKGSYVIRAERAAGSGNHGRRVNVTATYRSGC